MRFSAELIACGVVGEAGAPIVPASRADLPNPETAGLVARTPREGGPAPKASVDAQISPEGRKRAAAQGRLPTHPAAPPAGFPPVGEARPIPFDPSKAPDEDTAGKAESADRSGGRAAGPARTPRPGASGPRAVGAQSPARLARPGAGRGAPASARSGARFSTATPERGAA